jgi:uncharacterized membrane protein
MSLDPSLEALADMVPSTLTSALHTLAAVVWVGGMFFAHVVLRPSISELEPPQRLALMNRVLGRFFVWVWIAVVALPATGYGLVFAEFGGFADSGAHIHVMQGVGWVMIGLFVYLHAYRYRRFRAAVLAADWPEAGARLAPIRHIVAVNLVLGLVNVAVGASGRFWG